MVVVIKHYFMKTENSFRVHSSQVTISVKFLHNIFTIQFAQSNIDILIQKELCPLIKRYLYRHKIHLNKPYGFKISHTWKPQFKVSLYYKHIFVFSTLHVFHDTISKQTRATLSHLSTNVCAKKISSIYSSHLEMNLQDKLH